MGIDAANCVSSGRAQVRLFQRGEPVGFATVDHVDADGLQVRADVPGLTLGTYLEMELLDRDRWRVGAMVVQHSSQGIGLVFASWSPQLFELIHWLAGRSEAGPLPGAHR